jgi:Ca-activated chloride channel family protein
VPAPLYLPIAIKDPPCTPDQQHADVILVLDTSSSMQGSKLAAAQTAARSFVGLLRLPGDQVAVVAFNQHASLASPLTSNPQLALTAIDTLHTQPGTRIDRALRLALDELGSTRRIATNQPITVLLTDGVQYEEPQTAQAVALEVRTAGVSIYAIGLGADVDAAFLHALAGAPSRYYFAPTEGDLEAIYRQIARTIPCPPQHFWRGGRFLAHPPAVAAPVTPRQTTSF